MILEIEPNANCEATDMKVFQESGPTREIHEIRYYRKSPEPFWCSISGWTTDNRPCPALAQRIGDSGDGEAILIYGGNAGLRLKRLGDAGDWSLENIGQWGEPYLVYGDENDVR